MALFGFGKKKEEKASPACCCAGGTESTSCAAVSGSISCAKVLGTGCKACHTLLENTRTALCEMNIAVEPEYVTDMPTIAEYGVMSLPALVVNEKVIAFGKVLKPAEIIALFSKTTL